MARIYFLSLGCDKNRVDAEIMSAKLVSAGHTIVDDAAGADCAVVNTCGFIADAQAEAIECILDMAELKRGGLLRSIVVTGCLAQRNREEAARAFPEVDAVAGLSGNEDIVGIVEGTLRGESYCGGFSTEGMCLSGERLISTPGHYAYLKIAEGCSNHCTYCTIPSIRGPYRSRPEDELVDEARRLVEGGVRELILIAQDTTSYGSDLGGKASLAGLLRRLCGLEGLWRARILYAYPDRITDDLIEVIAENEKAAKYLDIPMQHASDAVLKRMGRGTGGKDLRELVSRLRERVDGITLRSTFIVGFPGETDGQFCELCDFLKELRLERAGCFEFSAEDGTPAERLGGQVPDEVKRERAEQLRLLQSSVMDSRQRERVGSVCEVICDGFDEETGMFACRGDADAPEVDGCVWLPLECDLMPGEVYRVRIVSADGADVTAELA